MLVLDDVPDDAVTATRPLEDEGFRAEPVSEVDPSLDADAFLATLVGRYDALVCDHVLKGRRHVSFTGAELVSKANSRPQHDMPAVLITSHINTDETGSIHRWLAGIPAIVDKTDLADGLVPALEYTQDELCGRFSEERRTFATPIEVLEVQPHGEVPRAKVVVVGWRIDTSVWMPLPPVLEETGLSASELPGRWLEANVNCYAKNPQDLYYRNITLAPTLPESWLTA